MPVEIRFFISKKSHSKQKKNELRARCLIKWREDVWTSLLKSALLNDGAILLLRGWRF